MLRVGITLATSSDVEEAARKCKKYLIDLNF